MKALSLKSMPHNLPLMGLLAVQLLSGMLLVPLTNFGSIYLNEALLYSLQEVSFVIALGQIVGMVASVVGGSLSDTRGHKWVLFLGVSLLATSALLYIIRVPVIVIALWCFANAGIGLSAVSGQGYLTLASSEENLGVSSALYNWGYTVGGAIGIPIATLILGDDNFSALGVALLGLGVVTSVIATIMPVLRETSALTETDTTTTTGYGVLLRREIIILIALRFLPTCFYGVMTLLPLVIKQVSGSNTMVAWYVTGSSIFATLTQLVAGRVADKLGVKLPTQLAFIAILLAIVGMVATDSSLIGLFVFGFIGIGAAWALSTLLPGMVTRATEPRIRGRVFGSLHLIWTGAMAFGTLLGGNLFEVDFRLPFLIVGILNIVALSLTFPFFKMTGRKAHE